MSNALETGFELDRRWHWLRGEMEESKKPALYRLAQIFAERGIPYAIIGGVALQIRQEEPRTTLDIDVAVLRRDAIPRETLEGAGFQKMGSHEHSENWTGPNRTPIQFTDDPAFAPGIQGAEGIPLDDIALMVFRPVDLLHAKLRAGSDPARRRSKRLQDLADAQALLEKFPQLTQSLSTDERRLIDQLPK
jgi:hypothetical protein